MQNPSHSPDSSNSSTNIHLQPAGSSQTQSPPKKNSSSSTAQEFNNFVADIEELLKATTNLSGEDLEKAKVKLQERIKSARETITEISQSLGPRTREAATITNNYVHTQPWKAIGISAATGFLSGYLFSRR